MGYLGFGLRKEVYERKGKEPFRKVRDVYGDNMEDIPNRTNQKPTDNLEEILEFNAAKNSKNRLRAIFFNTFIVLAGAVFILFLLLYISGSVDALF